MENGVVHAGSSNTVESLSGGFVYGAGGSGLITPRMWMSPLPSGSSSPVRGGGMQQQQEQHLNAGDLGLDMALDQQHASAVTV